MFEAVKRKLGQHRSYRRLRKHWEDFLAAREGAFDVYSPHLNDFLLAFESMYTGVNEDSKQMGAAIDKVYGDCTEIMVTLVDWLHLHADKDCDWGGTGMGIGLKALRVVEFILQNEKYREEASKHDLTAKVVVLLDIEQLDAKTILLKLIASLGTNEQSRLEIVRLQGLGKMAQLLQQGDADLTKQILKTLREFCVSPPEEGAKREEEGAEDGSEAVERPVEGEISKTKTDTITATKKLSLTGVVQGFGRLARAYFPTQESKVQPHKRGAKKFPPRRRDLVEMVTKLEQLQLECPRDSPDSSTQDVLPALIHGMISPAIPSIQLDLLATICQLLYKNKRNQKTFQEVGGYPSILQLLEEAIRIDNANFLAHCFHLIFTLILDGADSKEIGNLEALEWLFGVVQTATMTPIRVHAGECLMNLITINPLNVVYFRHVKGPQLLLAVMTEQCQRALIGLDDGSRAVPCGKLVANCRGPGPDWAVVETVDALLRSIIAVFTRYDFSVATEYAQLLWQVPIGALHPDFTFMLSTTVAELLCHFHLFHVEIVEGAVELSLQLVRTSMNVIAKAMADPCHESTSDFVSICPFHGADCVLKSAATTQWNEIQLSLLTPAALCKQIAVVLQILGHAVLGREIGLKVTVFHRHAGFRVLIDLVKLMTCCNAQGSAEVIDMALFLLRRCAGVWCQLSTKKKPGVKPEDSKDSSDAFALVPLLETSRQLPLAVQLKICKTIIVLFRAVPDANVNSRSISRSSSRSTRSSKSVSRSSRHHPRMADDEGQRKKLQVQITEFQNALKISFCHAGGLDCLMKIMRAAPLPDTTFTVAAFLCVSELIRHCEPVKIYFGRHIGYCEFAETLKRTNVVLEHHVFDVAFELSTTGDLTPLQSGAASFQRSVDLVMTQIFTTLEDEGVVLKFIKAASPVREQERKKGSPEESKPTNRHNGSSGHLMSERHDSDTDSICSDLELDLTQMTQLDVDVEPTMPPLGTPIPHSRVDSIALEDAVLPIDESRVRDLSINISRPRDASLPDPEPLMIPIASEEPEKESWQTLTSMKFRSSEAALMVIILLPHAPPAVQTDVIKKLSDLLEANPSNKRALCQVGVVSILLRLYPYFHEEAQGWYLQLIATLGSYDVTQKEIRLLFDMAASPPSTSLHLESSTSPLYMPLYHSPIVPEELQMQMLYVIGRLAERSAPANYFSFDGLVSCLRMVPLVRFPASKSGYSMNCWLQMSLFFEQESSLLTWEDHTGSVIFELLFVCHPALKPARFLAVRTRQGTFPFRQFCLEEGSDWHHLVICHDKRALRITLDGQGISLIKEVAYPVAAKATPLCGRVGAGVDSHATSFCGAVGSVNFFEGAIEKHHVKLLFEQGPLFGDTRDFKQLGIANKVFLTLNPEDFELESNKSKVQLAALTGSTSPERSLLDISSLVMASPNDGSPDLPARTANSPVLEAVGEIEVHTTRSMKREIGRVGSIFLCLPFLNMGSRQMIAGLRLMAALLDRYQPNIQTFQKSNGFDVLTYLLSSSKMELSREVFDLLLDMTHGHIGVQIEKRRLNSVPGLQSIVDLLRDPKCELETRSQVLAMLAQSITHNAKSLEAWRIGPGIVGLIELLLSPGGLYPHLLTILGRILPVCRFEEFEILAKFLASEIESVHFQEEVCELFRLLVDVTAKRPALLEYLVKLGGVDLIYLFLRSPLEPVRVDCCRLIGLLFSTSSSKAFLKAGGYDFLSHLLETQHVSSVILGALTQLALGKFVMQTDADHDAMSEFSYNDRADQPDGKDDDDEEAEAKMRETPTSKHSQPSAAISEFQRDIVYPHVLQVNMRLLRFADLQTSLHWLNQLDLMMDKVENIDRILDSDWLMWCHSYLQADSDVEDPSHMQRVLAKFYSVLQKTIIRDLARPMKQCELVKLKEFPETADFFLIVFENILDYFEQHPRVEAAFAAQLLRNLGLVFDYVESVIGLPPSMCVRAISVINLLASQNESTIRGRMKDNGLFDIRDNIVLRCIREEMPQEVRLDTFCVVSFEMVAVQPIFRDSGGIVCMLKMLHDCGNVQLQEAIADILRNQLGRVEACRQTIFKYIQDPLVFKLLCPDPELEESLSAPDGPEDETKTEYPSDDSVSEFIRWYFAEGQKARRDAIQQRVTKHFVPYQTAALRVTQKLSIRKDKALRTRLQKLSTADQAKKKLISETLNRGKSRMLPKCVSKLNTKLGEARDAQLARQGRGKSSWKEICSDLKLENTIKPELKLEDEDDETSLVEEQGAPSTPPAATPVKAKPVQAKSPKSAAPISIDSTTPAVSTAPSSPVSSNSISTIPSVLVNTLAAAPTGPTTTTTTPTTSTPVSTGVVTAPATVPIASCVNPVPVPSTTATTAISPPPPPPLPDVTNTAILSPPNFTHATALLTATAVSVIAAPIISTATPATNGVVPTALLTTTSVTVTATVATTTPPLTATIVNPPPSTITPAATTTLSSPTSTVNAVSQVVSADPGLTDSPVITRPTSSSLSALPSPPPGPPGPPPVVVVRPKSFKAKKPPEPPPVKTKEAARPAPLAIGDLQAMLSQLQTANQQADQLKLILQMQSQLQMMATGLAVKPQDPEVEETKKEQEEPKKKRMSQDASCHICGASFQSSWDQVCHSRLDH